MGRCRKIFEWNGTFVGVVLAIIVTFSILVCQFFIRENNIDVVFYILCFFFFMSMWSYVTVVLTDPGSVPAFWGLYSQRLGGQRKYCLICRNFKPERSHHCSKCKQCVLNMDHHCPWINNCVGFQNRKYFMLFIIYLLIALTLAVVEMTMVMVSQIKLVAAHSMGVDVHFVLKMALYLFYALLEVTLLIFIFMHIQYVVNNTTTIEQMVLQKKKKAGEGHDFNFRHSFEENEFNISCFYNFTQVFGENAFYWLVPVEEERLRGHGVYWDKQQEFAKRQLKWQTKFIH